jgi:membrane protease YdiL (CAAX protease family)
MNESRPPLTPIIFYVGLFFIVWTLRATLLYSIDTSIESESLRHLYSNAVKFVVWVVPVFVYLVKVDGKNPFRYLRLSTMPSKASLLFGGVAVVLYFAAVLALSLFAQGKRLSFNFDGVALLSTSASSLSEEVLFRGFMLNQLRERASFWAANLATAFLFVLVHLPNWLWTRGFQTQLLSDCVGIFVLACFLGYLLKKTDSLWFCVGAHVANNFLASVLRA